MVADFFTTFAKFTERDSGHTNQQISLHYFV